MPAHRLSGANAKLSWGYEHLERFKRVLEKFAQSQPYRVTKYGDDQPSRWGVKLTEPLPSSLPLIVGDCVQNYRAALDYVAYELGIRCGMARRHYRVIDFPFSTSRRGFDNTVVGRILKPDERAFIQRYQPYRNLPRRGNPLWILRHLSNTDKHRRLRFMPRVGLGSTTVVAHGGRWHFISQYRDIGPRTEAVFDFPIIQPTALTSRSPSAFQMEMDSGTRLHVLFDKRTAYVGQQPVINVLRTIGIRVEEIISACETEFF